MLNLIKDINDPLLSYIKDDPVRPEIPTDFRVSKNRFVGFLGDSQSPQAIVCVSLHSYIPQKVEDLYEENSDEEPNTAVFYTIWSYVPGKASDLLFAVVDEIKKSYPTVTRFITLSPKTMTARKFHLRNGANIFRENEHTINYEYSLVK